MCDKRYLQVRSNTKLSGGRITLVLERRPQGSEGALGDTEDAGEVANGVNDGSQAAAADELVSVFDPRIFQ